MVVQVPPSDRRPTLFWPLLCAWLLSFVCFTLPGRDAPETIGSLDVVAIAKLAARLFSIAILGGTLLRAWHHPKRAVVLICLMPYAAFVAWAILSTAWSSLKAVSLGQAAGLVSMLLLAASVPLCWRGPRDTSLLLGNCTAALFVFSLFILVVHLISPDSSGLNRDEWATGDDGSYGFIHPTTAGATASLGLTLLVGCWLLLDYRWSRILLVPGMAVQTATLLFSQSRMALGMAALALSLILILGGRLAWTAAAGLAIALIGTLYLALDPNLDLAGGTIDKALSFVARGQSSDEMSTFTGRLELWEIIWDSFLGSPVMGHGYFVTSASGEIEVWQTITNRSAHNALLQVLVTTGLIGTLLFVIGLLHPLRLAAQSFFLSVHQRAARGWSNQPAADPRLGALLFVVGVWYLGWGQLSESFMGPVQPESVVFYSLFGLAISQIQPSLVLSASLRRATTNSMVGVSG